MDERGRRSRDRGSIRPGAVAVKNVGGPNGMLCPICISAEEGLARRGRAASVVHGRALV
jgi:hypothetical protein